MDVTTRNRAQLKAYFVRNSIPTESNFAELIDGMLNQKDDGVVKLPGNPLTIEAAGDSASEKKALTIYQSFADPNPAWTLSLNLRRDPKDPGPDQLGLNISDGEGNSRLFIDRSTGNIGIGTARPQVKLAVAGAATVGLDFQIDLQGSAFESTDGNTTSLSVNSQSVAIDTMRGLNTVILSPSGTAKARINFDIYGSVALWNDWADWVNANAANGDIVAVASYDAVNNAPRGGSADRLLTAIGAIKAFTMVSSGVPFPRIPYALVFILGRTIPGRTNQILDVAQPYRGPNAIIRTSYYKLVNAPAALSVFGDILLSGNVGIGVPNPGVKLEVAGTVKASELRTTLYTATGGSAVTLSNVNAWADFPDLTQTFTLAAATNVLAFYQVTMGGDNSHMVTRLAVDSAAPQTSRAIAGNTQYWSPSNVWIGTLNRGTHTVKVQYRSPTGGPNSPDANDFHSRVLQVLVFGS